LLNNLIQSPDWNRIKRMVIRMQAIASNSPSIVDLNKNNRFCQLLNKFNNNIKKYIPNKERSRDGGEPTLNELIALISLIVFIYNFP